MGPLLLALALAAAPPAPAAPASPATPSPLSLEQALRLAREHQPALKLARAQVEAARARADEARAPLLPQLSFASSWQRTTANFKAKPGSLPKQFQISQEPSFDTFNYFTAGPQLTQEIDFGANSDRWRSALAKAAGQAQTERALASQAALAVRQAYFNARGVEALVELARQTLASQERHLATVQGFVQMGSRPEIDLAQAKADRASAELQLIQAQGAAANARAQLDLAIGVETAAGAPLADEEMPRLAEEELPAKELLAQALAARPDLASLRSQLKAQQLALRSVQGGYLPTLEASTTATFAGTELSNVSWNFAGQVALNWGLFQGGLVSAQAHEARANLAALQAQVEQLEQAIAAQLVEVRAGVSAAQAALGATGELLANSRERLRLAEGRYAAGSGSALELSDAQLAVSAAAAQRIQAQYALSLARAQLQAALGRE